MPGGLSEPLGLLAFPAIKVAGYTAYAFYLNRLFPHSKQNVLLIGVLRMLVGLAFGTALAFVSFPFVFVFGIGLFIYVIGLIPVRLLEWYIIIKGFYTRHGTEGEGIQKPMWFGVLTSFLLDIPALLGLVMSAGFWIC